MGRAVAAWLEAALPGRECRAVSAETFAAEVASDGANGALTRLLDLGLATTTTTEVGSPVRIESLRPVPLELILEAMAGPADGTSTSDDVGMIEPPTNGPVP